jgi:peptide-methionine (S)-S-oxide reductase
METITLGGGCFWCLDAVYRRIKGVESSTVGYAGGEKPDPTYEAVSTGTSGYAEVVQIGFNPSEISLQTVLEIFWTIHDPTTLNRQGADVGHQYRSIILYNSDSQKQLAESSKAEAQKLWENPIVTEVEPLTKFYPAEAYHQDYFNKNPEKSYCQVVINPKLVKLRQKFAPLLKDI